MFCSKCGKDIAEDDNYCRKCGTPLLISTNHGTAISGNVTTGGGNFIGRDLVKKFGMSLNWQSGCINITIIQIAILLIAVFLGTMAYQTPEIQAGTRRVIAKILERIERKNTPPLIILPTPTPIFHPMPLLNVVLLTPSDSAILSGTVTFEWSAKVELQSNEGFELVIWSPGDDPNRNAYSLEGAGNFLSITIPLDKFSAINPGVLVNGRTYQWGVRIYNKTTRKAELISEARSFIYNGN